MRFLSGNRFEGKKMLPMLGTEPCLFHAVGSLFSDSLKNIHINTKAPLKGIIQLNLLYGFFFVLGDRHEIRRSCRNYVTS